MAEETKKVEETKEEVKDNVTKARVKPTRKTVEDDVIKVDLSKPVNKEEKEEPKVEEKEEDVIVVNEEPKVEEKEEDTSEAPTIEEVTDEEPPVEIESDEEEVVTSEYEGKPLSEKLQKVAEFMEQTGGNLNDYVALNRDVSKLDDSEVLDEYYRATKSHLTPEERNFLQEESFGYNEEDDDPRDIRRKKIALKEQVAEARAHLDRQKSKYYEDINAGSRLTKDQEKAVKFFNRYNKDSAKQQKLNQATKKVFKQKTENVFNKNFKGFDYEIGDKKFRFNVKNPNEVKEVQSDLNNFVDKFMSEDKTTIGDAAGYHKSLFTAMNADVVAKHFYEQGKADAIKGQIAKDKNINLDPRQTHGETNVGGVKYKVLGDSADDFKIKIKKRFKK